MSSADVGSLCFLKSTVNAAIYQNILKHFMLPSAEKLYGDADFIFQQDLVPAHTDKSTKSWFNDHGFTVLDWPANSPDLNQSMRYCQEKNERYQTQQCRWPEGRYQSNLGFHYTWAVPQADCLHATPHWWSNSCKKRPNQVLSAYKWTYFSEAWHFCLKYHFLLILCYILIFRDTEFWVVIICKP